MNTSSVQRELGYLLKALPKYAHGLVMINCEPASLFGEPLARHFKDGTVYIISSDAKDFELAKTMEGFQNVRVELAVNLDFIGNEQADLIILRSSGFESKERLFAQIADAAAHLKRGGRLYLLTHKQRGARGHAELIERALGNHEIVFRGGGGFRIITAVKADTLQSPTQSATSIIEETILDGSYRFQTSPAVFSRKRVDLGTRLFLDHLSVNDAKRILDLGCGYGVIGIVLARRFPDAQITLVDVDLESTNLARKNTELNGVTNNTTVILSDGLKQLPDTRFDLVVSHFPLHISREEFTRVTTEVYDSLLTDGRLCGVALSAYDVRPTIERVFGNVETVADMTTDLYSYRIICAVK